MSLSRVGQVWISRWNGAGPSPYTLLWLVIDSRALDRSRGCEVRHLCLRLGDGNAALESLYEQHPENVWDERGVRYRRIS